MEKTRILFVSQEIVPYLKDSQMGTIGRHLPQGIQEKGREIRTFMPRFGHINERRNQLHEVIRLSGMNLIIDDTDHPLIIKVASIQSARMQIYFIDNDDYFQRKSMFRDKNNKFFKDNEERAIFFSRGVIETVKKLGWSPDLVHCHGWMTSLIPIYIKRAFRENPLFSETKIITSLYDDDFEEPLNKDFANKIKLDGITIKDLKHFKVPTYTNMMMSAIDFSEGIIVGSENANPQLVEYANSNGKLVLPFQSNNFIDVYNNFYDKVLASPVIAND